MTREEVDILIWEYLDDDISTERLKLLQKLRNENVDVKDRINEFQTFHNDLREMPVYKLDHKTAASIKQVMRHSHSTEFKWEYVNIILLASVVLCATGLYFLFQNFGTLMYSHEVPKVSDINFTVSIDQIYSFDTTYLWMYVVLLLIIPIQSVLDRFFQARLYKTAVIL